MGIGEGIAAGGLLITLAGIVFNLGKAWHRLQGHSDAIRTIKTHCEEFTLSCGKKQDGRYEEVRERLDAVKDDTQAVREAIAAVKVDVAWLRKANGGSNG